MRFFIFLSIVALGMPSLALGKLQGSSCGSAIFQIQNKSSQDLTISEPLDNNFNGNWITTDIKDKSTQHIIAMTSACNSQKCTIKIATIGGGNGTNKECLVTNVSMSVQNNSDQTQCEIESFNYDAASCGGVKSKLITTKNGSYPTIVVGDGLID